MKKKIDKPVKLIITLTEDLNLKSINRVRFFLLLSLWFISIVVPTRPDFSQTRVKLIMHRGQETKAHFHQPDEKTIMFIPVYASVCVQVHKYGERSHAAHLRRNYKRRAQESIDVYRPCTEFKINNPLSLASGGTLFFFQFLRLAKK